MPGVNPTDNLSLYSSLIIEWAFEGDQDLARYNNTLNSPDFAAPLTNGYNDAFDGIYSLNLGASYAIGSHTDITLDLYDILGWIDKDFNKT